MQEAKEGGSMEATEVTKLVAEGLVAALKLDPEKKYILLFQRGALPMNDVLKLSKWLDTNWGIKNMVAIVADPPAEAVLGIQIEEAT